MENKGNYTARLERLPWTSLHTKLLILLAIGEFFDLFDLFIGGFVVPSVAAYYKVGRADAVFYTVALLFLGAFVGCLLFTLIGDAYGRRTAIVLNMFLLSIGELLIPLASNIGLYGLFRFISGLGVGPEAVLVLDIMSTEFFPARIRGRRLALGYTLAWTSPIVIAVLSIFIIPRTFIIPGWQWLYIISGLGILSIIPLRFLIPESPRWLEVKGKFEEAEKIVSKFEERALKEYGSLPPLSEIKVVKAEKIPISTIFSKEYRKRTTMLWIFEFFQTAAYYGFTSLAVTVLLTKGFTIVSTLQYSLIIYTGYFTGSLISVFIIDSKKFDRKWQIVTMIILIGIDGLIFGYSLNVPILLTSGFILANMANIFSNAFHQYGAELYPTRIRGFATGAQYSLSRLGNFIWQTYLPKILVAYGPFAMFLAIFIIAIVVALDVGILGPKASQIKVEELSP
ncbi:MFS transporter [Sulfolobus acidocaldarius]|uniref:Sugar transporter n=3 Tax=Sulfolobus acidocaldarius TaxID=2285 RepID=Q4J761_SULAC|nr:MFS transporter [Sulfolobus acidocaldarius]AAY81370.1 sugar transporter [Sulfolobus acidocaldarius DSM 639]AGE74284.1 sugar transporter [Sulfolobus acidocaldarius Ron12/I]ALU29833.1 MFS transporter [Sulfolobus acidocaldarius]ALU32572.1 MFS transporter [Sulfolobus acidocaldarius]WCM35871.1 MFS transporter [Sulfolobus acidocaldarius DSM 639]